MSVVSSGAASGTYESSQQGAHSSPQRVSQLKEKKVFFFPGPKIGDLLKYTILCEEKICLANNSHRMRHEHWPVPWLVLFAKTTGGDALAKFSAKPCFIIYDIVFSCICKNT